MAHEPSKELSLCPGTHCSGAYSDSKFWGTLRRASRAAGSAALRPALELYFVMTASETPLWAKAAAVGALGYLILPVDLVPDWLPGVGWTDDIAVMLGTLRTLSSYNTPAIQQKAREAAERLMSSVVRRGL
jgi:uncharacterized membrane protein YkvA (DUF1232 family)